MCFARSHHLANQSRLDMAASLLKLAIFSRANSGPGIVVIIIIIILLLLLLSLHSNCLDFCCSPLPYSARSTTSLSLASSRQCAMLLLSDWSGWSRRGRALVFSCSRVNRNQSGGRQLAVDVCSA